MLNHLTNPENRKKLDQYFTPAWATAALLDTLDDLKIRIPDGVIWEPCAGAGHMSQALRTLANREVYATEYDPDLVPLVGEKIERGINFLECDRPPNTAYQGRVTSVITNPPYNTGIATGTQIVKRAVSMYGFAACLMTNGWLEGCRDRVDFLPLFSDIIMLPRIQFFGTSGRNISPSIWAVYQEDFRDAPPRMHWADRARCKELERLTTELDLRN